jgi:putative acyl-CoA dehydrogenase
MFLDEVENGSGIDSRLDRAIGAARSALTDAAELEFGARRIVGLLATTWAGTLLARHGEPEVFEAYAVSRLANDHGQLFGTLPPGTHVDTIVERAIPHPGVGV